MDALSVAIGLLVLSQVAICAASWRLHLSHERDKRQWAEERHWLSTCAIVSNGGRVPVDPAALETRRQAEHRRSAGVTIQVPRGEELIGEKMGSIADGY